MKRHISLLAAVLIAPALLIAGCQAANGRAGGVPAATAPPAQAQSAPGTESADDSAGDSADADRPDTEGGAAAATTPPAQTQNEEDTTMEDTANVPALQMAIGGQTVHVEWEDNEAAAALFALASEEPLTVQLTMYGDFEQFGPLGAALPSDDVQTTTACGDIVLYTGDQIVVFYGSNTWAYTRLGHITDKTPEELAQLLGSGDTTLTLSAG